MSEVDTALTGAEVAPVDNAETPPIEQANAPESTTEQVEATPQDDRPRDDKGRFVPQERLNEVTRHRREAERREQAQAQRADALERELADLRQRQPAHQPQSNNDVPSLEAFNYDMAAWSAAMTEHVTQRTLSQAEQRLQQAEQQRIQRQVAEQFDSRSREYATANPGFEDRVADMARIVQFHPAVVEVIGTSDHGPAVADYLATHLDEADRIARMQPHLAALQLGRIEAKVSAPKPKPVSNAPAPAPVLGGGSAVQKDPERMSTDEWLKWRRDQLKAK